MSQAAITQDILLLSYSDGFQIKILIQKLRPCLCKAKAQYFLIDQLVSFM